MTVEDESTDNELNEKLIDIVRFFTYKSAGHTSTRRIAKLSYLSELLYIEKHSHRMTSEVFLNYDYGPWSFDLARAFEAVEAECEDMKVVRMDTVKGNARIFQPTKLKTTVKLDKNGYAILTNIFDTFGYVPTDIIVTFTKRSSLFKETRYGLPIDMARYTEVRAEAICDLKSGTKGTTVKLPSLGYLWDVQIEDSGFSAENIDISGCITEGETLEELELNMRLGILGYLKCEAELHEAAP